MEKKALKTRNTPPPMKWQKVRGFVAVNKTNMQKVACKGISFYVIPGLNRKNIRVFIDDSTKAEIIKKIVLEQCGVTEKHLYSRCRKTFIVDARQILCLQLRKRTGLTLIQVAEVLKYKDHASVIGGVRHIEDVIRTNDDMKSMVAMIDDKIVKEFNAVVADITQVSTPKIF